MVVVGVIQQILSSFEFHLADELIYFNEKCIKNKRKMGETISILMHKFRGC